MKTYEELLVEHDALAAQLALIQDTWRKAGLSEKCNDIAEIRKAITSTPRQCLADIKAEAVIEFAKEVYDAGETSFSAADFVLSYAVEYVQNIRKAGTWLRDENVNGGKRQGGEK